MSTIPAHAQERLAAYLAHIGLDRPGAADATALETVQHAHRMAIGFENIDVMLGRGIDVEPEAVFAKLVMQGRGGYCFEHNQLFGAMLAELGFANRPLLGRVWLGLAEGIVPPRTHTLRLVAVEGAPWIADAGFGGSYVPALPLVDGAQAATRDGAVHRLRLIGGMGDVRGQWLLERAGPARATDGRAAMHTDWQPQYSFDMAQVDQVDLALSNHWTSTRPATRFTRECIASIVLEDGFASLQGRRLSMYAGGRGDVMEITRAQDWRTVLGDLFRVDLSLQEVEMLVLF